MRQWYWAERHSVDLELSSIYRDLFNPDKLLGALLWAVVFLVVATFVAGALRRFARRIESHLSDVTGLQFAVAFSQVLAYVAAFILYAHLVPQLRALASTLLAGVGVVSVVLGLAAQNTLGNLIAGFSLVLYRPFRVGDRIQLTTPAGMKTAVVEGISLGFTILRDTDSQNIIVPNSIMGSSIIIRLDAQSGAAESLHAR